LGEILADLIRFGQYQNHASSKKIRSPTAMPKCLLFLISIAETTGMNLNIENNMLRLLCFQSADAGAKPL